MRTGLALAVLALVGTAAAATLEKLPLGTLIDKSTSIVRGRVGSPVAGVRGPLIYTYYPVTVTEVLKGTSGVQTTVALPGGSNGRVQQWATGVPQLHPGDEYVLFLWTSRSGLTQLLGLSQGLFTISYDSGGQTLLSRRASSETLVDPETRQPVTDEDVQLYLSDLRARVQRQGQGTAAK